MSHFSIEHCPLEFEESVLTAELNSTYLQTTQNPNQSASLAGEFTNNTRYLWCTDYADDIIWYLKEIEVNRKQITFKSPQIDYRQNLLQLIKNRAENCALGRTTVHLGWNLIV